MAESRWKAVRMAKTSEARASWSGKWMFILAAAASAVGLGNMWRFPYLDAKYGGGTFIFVYLILVFTFGVSMLLLETSLGRKTGQSAIGAFASFGSKYKFIGFLAAAVPFIITPYYCIIGGWVAKYCFSYISTASSAMADGGDYFVSFITSSDVSYLWMLVFMAICFIVVSLGVKGGIEKAKDVCRNTRGPVASIFYQGLDRYDQGLDVVEKSIVSYGSVQMSNMEKGLSWISLFIAIAPSLGFLGTVIGMIQAFDAIQAAGDISPNVVAGGMKVALITTVGGLIVAMILQVFYNYILAKIESINIDMEESSIDLVDILAKNK